MNLAEAVEQLRGITDHPQMSLPESEALKVVLAEAERVTTLVACEKCGRGVRWRYSVKGLCPDCAATEIDRLAAENADLGETNRHATSIADDLLRQLMQARTLLTPKQIKSIAGTKTAEVDT